MKKYEYKVVSLKWNRWLGTAKTDYLEVINEYGEKGWRFVQFAPARAHSSKSKGVELVFERQV